MPSSVPPFILSAVFLLYGASVVNAQPKTITRDLFVASSVPDSLKKNADAVVRWDETDLDIHSPRKVNIKTHRIVTIFNRNASTEQFFREYHNSFQKVESASMTLYDAEGREIRTYRKKDMEDRAVIDGEVLVGDDRIIDAYAATTDYPVTVETQSEVQLSTNIGYPGWDILSPGISLQNGFYTARVHEGMDLRYENKNTLLRPDISMDGKDRVYSWSVAGLRAIREETGSRTSQYLPAIMMAPGVFEYANSAGDMNSWKQFGSWYYGFSRQDTPFFSPARTADVQAMVKSAKSEKEKVKILYEYLQKNTRYVNISLGIGGLKPFPASFVDERKYGDCKALANYMRSLLQVAGIPSFLALVNAGSDEGSVDADFPENGFNHVIVCVPLSRDTVWLECTSNINEFGVLGSFTENRKALLITDNGGVLVNTPAGRCNENTFSSTTLIRLNDDGSGDSQVTLRTTGDFRDMIYGIFDENNDDQKSRLMETMGYRQPDDLKVEKVPAAGNEFYTRIDMNFEKIPEFSAGTELFLAPRLYRFWGKNLPDDQPRLQNFYFPFPLRKFDTTIYQVPPGYTVANLPGGVNVHFDEGTYHSTYTYDAGKNQVETVAALTLENNKIPPSGFDRMKEAFISMEKDANQRIVIRKKDL